MLAFTIDGLSILLAALLVGTAVKKWNILRDRREILSVIKNTLKDKKSLVSGIFIAILYLAVFMMLGGKGGRVHVLFGRVIWNTTAEDLLTGVFLAILVMISMALFVFCAGELGVKQSGRESRMGFLGSMLALMAGVF